IELYGDHAVRRNVGIGFKIVTGFDSIDVQLMVVAPNPYDVAIPATFIDKMLQGMQIACHQQRPAVFVINVTPMAVTDIGLIAYHVTIYHVRAVLDTTVDEARSGVAR